MAAITSKAVLDDFLIEFEPLIIVPMSVFCELDEESGIKYVDYVFAKINSIGEFSNTHYDRKNFLGPVEDAYKFICEKIMRLHYGDKTATDLTSKIFKYFINYGGIVYAELTDSFWSPYADLDCALDEEDNLVDLINSTPIFEIDGIAYRFRQWS